MKKLALLAAAVLTASGLGVAGAIAQAGGADAFAKADANKDGTVDFTEAQGVFPTLTEDLFKKADADNSGTLDEAEFGSLQGLVGALGSTTEKAAPSSAPAEASSSAAK